MTAAQVFFRKEGFQIEEWTSVKKYLLILVFTLEPHIWTLPLYRVLKRSRESRRDSLWWGRKEGQRKVCRRLWGLWWWHSWWWDLLWKPSACFVALKFLEQKVFWQISMQLLSINSEPHFFLLGGRRAERNIWSFGKDLLLILTKSEKVVLQMKTFLGRPA